MEVRFGIYETPQPEGEGKEKRLHARVHPYETIRLDGLCEELGEKGINSASVKAVLDAIKRIMEKSLMRGFNVELEGIGTFSLSLHTQMVEKKPGIKTPHITIDGINFRANKQLKEKVKRAKLEADNRQSHAIPPLTVRRQRMITYLEKYGYISGSKYARINGCSRYQARKDLEAFLQEKLVHTSGQASHKVYQLL